MNITFLGVGEAFDGRFGNTSLLVQTGEHILLDCGSTVPPALWRFNADPDFVDALVLSHGHADHAFGFPALLGRFSEDRRTKPLTIIGSPNTLQHAQDLAAMGYPGLTSKLPFPMRFVGAEAGAVVRTRTCSLQFAETTHSLPNLAVRIDSGHAVVCYSGDGRSTEASNALYSGADLLVQEAYSFEPIPTHGEIGELLETGATCGVKRLALVHIQRDVRSGTRILEAIERAAVPAHMPLPFETIAL